METRKLGYTDMEISRIVLGTWAIGGGGYAYGWGPQKDKESIATIRRAMDLGINCLDTAAVYGLGHSEEVVGEAIADRRDEIYVATKCGRVWDEGGYTPYARLTEESVRQEIDDSLRRLDVDVVDLYQIHWPEPDDQIEEGWRTIADLIEQGKVRYGGVSNFSVAQLERVQPIHPVASLQPPYSMLDRRIEDRILPYCAEHDIGVIVYSPMASGLLTGKYDRERVSELPDDDWRKESRQFTEPELSANLELVEGLRPIAQRNDQTMARLAVAWVLRRPEVTAAIVGARHPSQIEETVEAADWALSDDEVDEIESLLEKRERRLAA